MSNTVLIECKIEGLTPLILNAFHDAAAMQASGGNRSSASASDRGTPHDIASAKLYRDDKGALIVPGPNMLRCIIDGGSFFKAGRQKVTTQKSSLICACVMFRETHIPLVHAQPWQVDTRPVRIPATGGRILAYRPIFYDWALSFGMFLDTTLLGKALLRDVVDAAGLRVGLGDFRPGCKGPYGRFKVTNWRVDEKASGPF